MENSKIDPVLRWTHLRTESGEVDTTIGFATSPLEAETRYGSLRLALGGSGEARLLVPIDPRDRINKELGGKSLDIQEKSYLVGGKNTRFLDLVCLETSLESVFGEVVSDISRRVNERETPLKAVEESLKEFRNLLKISRLEITREKVVGLLGELMLLRQLMGYRTDAWQTWSGPEGGRHDFRSGKTALESKASVRTQKPVIEITSLDQLEPPKGGGLYLVHHIFESNPGGNLDVPSIAEELLGKAGCPDRFEELIEMGGYLKEDKEFWEKYKFNLYQFMAYQVSETFPRLTVKSFREGNPQEGISHIRYMLDLSVARDFAVGGSIQEILKEFTGCH